MKLLQTLDTFQNDVEKHLICGVRIYFKPAFGGVEWSKWKDTLETMLPQYDDVGWLDGLSTIIIGEGIVKGMGVGNYDHRGTIDLENDVSMGDLRPAVIDDSREHILTHEVLHHAHIGIHDRPSQYTLDQDEQYIQREVSYYAGKNSDEAVAEIGAALFLGAEFPDGVIEIYDKYGGPPEAKH